MLIKLCRYLLEKMLECGLIEVVDLIFRSVCQISGLDNTSYKIQKSYWYFQIKSFGPVVFVVFNGAKG